MKLYHYDNTYYKITEYPIVRESKNFFIVKGYKEELYVNKKTLRVRGKGFNLSFKDEKYEKAIKRAILTEEVKTLIVRLSLNEQLTKIKWDTTTDELKEIKSKLEDVFKILEEIDNEKKWDD